MRQFIFAAVQPPLLLCIALSFVAALAASTDPFVAFVFGLVLIHIVWTAGMNLLFGYTGLLPLVFAGIAGISAYGSVDLVTRQEWSIWAAIPVSAFGAAVIGVLLGLPSLRLRGFYFTLSTLVVQTVITLTFTYFSFLTGGDTGLSQIPPLDQPFSGQPITGLALQITLTVIAWLSIISILTILKTSFGRRLIAIREDEVLAEALGVNVTLNKMMAFFIGSFLAGVGGSLYAAYVGFISPRSFDLLASLNIWLMVAFGGRGTIVGPILGTLILVPVPYLLLNYATLKDVVYGALIITIAILLPSGVYGELKQIVGRSRNRH
jgi:branched-chain amino acid transport system permease protein